MNGLYSLDRSFDLVRNGSERNKIFALLQNLLFFPALRLLVFIVFFLGFLVSFKVLELYDDVDSALLRGRIARRQDWYCEVVLGLGEHFWRARAQFWRLVIHHRLVLALTKSAWDLHQRRLFGSHRLPDQRRILLHHWHALQALRLTPLRLVDFDFALLSHFPQRPS